MDQNAIVGIIAVTLVTFGGFFLTVKKSSQDELKAMTELKISIVELTSELKAVHQRDDVRDERLNKHGAEIDNLKIEVHDHETRIHNLEKYK